MRSATSIQLSIRPRTTSSPKAAMRTAEEITTFKVPTLGRLADREQVWARLAEKYGVTNHVPPWKSSLDGMCDALDREATALRPLTRRQEEDRLSRDVYDGLPFPESQLVALAHSLIAREVIGEDALARRMQSVRARLETA